MKTTFKDRPVEICDVDGLSGDPCDAFILAACYLDTEKELSAEELEQLSQETDFSEACTEYQIGVAEDWADQDR